MIETTVDRINEKKNTLLYVDDGFATIQTTGGQVTISHKDMHRLMDKYCERFNEMVCSETENALQKAFNVDVESKCKIFTLMGGKFAIASIFGLSLGDNGSHSGRQADVMIGPAQARLLLQKLNEYAKNLGWM